MHIVLVEDNSGDITLARMAFVEAGIPHDLTVLTDGEKAVDFFDQIESTSSTSIPDLVFIDLNLPRRDGFDVLAAIRSKPRLESMPVVIISGSQSEAESKRAYALKANALVVKHTDFDSAIETLKTTVLFWHHHASKPE